MPTSAVKVGAPPASPSPRVCVCDLHARIFGLARGILVSLRQQFAYIIIVIESRRVN